MKIKNSTFLHLPERILKWGLGAVMIDLIYILFFTRHAIENSRQGLLLLVPTMLEHIFCALAVTVAGAVIADLVLRENSEKK